MRDRDREKGKEREKEEKDFHSREEHLNLILRLTKLKKRENFVILLFILKYRQTLNDILY